MTLGENQEAFMRDVEKLLIYLHINGYSVRGGELERTQAQQEIYYNTGKSKTMQSNHLKRCAIDLHIFKNSVWLQSKQDFKINVKDILTISFKVWYIKKRSKIATPTIKTI